MEIFSCPDLHIMLFFTSALRISSSLSNISFCFSGHFIPFPSYIRYISASIGAFLISIETTGLFADTFEEIIFAFQFTAFLSDDTIKIGTRTSSGVHPPCAPRPAGTFDDKDLYLRAHIVFPSSSMV